MTIRWEHKFELSPGKWVFVPNEYSVRNGLALKEILMKKWAPPNYFYHFQKGGHVAALRLHINSKYFTKIDLSSFFYSVSLSRVTRSLRTYFGYQKARELAKLSTCIIPGTTNRCVPYGFPQSMLLASLALHRSALGSYLFKLQKHPQIKLSVYVDDILISSTEEEILECVNKDLCDLIPRSQFVLNTSKSQFSRQMVTIFNIDLAYKSLRICDEKFNEFVFKIPGCSNPSLYGILRYIRSINIDQSEKFWQLCKTQ